MPPRCLAELGVACAFAAALSGCSMVLPIDELSGGETSHECAWSLSDETRFTTAGRPYALDVADFDRDGVVDVALAENDSAADVDYATTEVQLGKGGRKFESWYVASKNSAPGGSMVTRGIAVGDVDKDGIPDAVQTFGSYATDDGSVDLNLGLDNGRLDWNGIWTVAEPDDAAVGDFDGDGWLDAVVVALTDQQGYADEKLFLLWGDGKGSFELPKEYLPADVFTKTIREVSVADLNADGRTDIVLTSWGDGALHVLLGTQDRGLSHRAEVQVGSAPWGLAARDFDADGKLDVACVNENDFTVSLLFGTGDGELVRETPITVGKGLQHLVATDLEGDGDADLVLGGEKQIVTLRNRGDGTFETPVSHPFDGTASRFAARDLDADGTADLVLSNLGRESFSVFWGSCQAR